MVDSGLVSAFMDSANPSTVRVLIRPPSASASTSSPAAPIPSAPPPDPPPSPSLQPPQLRPSENVVVVGFTGRRPDDVSHLINRILDLNAFGSGNLDKGLCLEKEELKGWFESRRISYYHDEERGILFLQYCSTVCPAMEAFLLTGCGFDSSLEEREFGDLQGMLFMFAVSCRFSSDSCSFPFSFSVGCLYRSVSVEMKADRFLISILGRLSCLFG